MICGHGRTAGLRPEDDKPIDRAIFVRYYVCFGGVALCLTYNHVSLENHKSPRSRLEFPGYLLSLSDLQWNQTIIEDYRVEWGAIKHCRRPFKADCTYTFAFVVKRS